MDRLTVPGTLQSLAHITEFVMHMAAAANLEPRVTYRLRLAVDEIVTNIITHGYDRAGQRGEITIWAQVEGQHLIVCVEDQGVSYDPRQVSPPDDLDRPLDKRKAGGLGVYLALGNVDQFRYEQDEDCNRSIFIVSRPGCGARGLQ